jgi:subtilisin family serine protease
MSPSSLPGRHGVLAPRFALPLLVLLAVLAGCTASDSVPGMHGAAARTTRVWVNLRSRPHLEAAPAIEDFAARGQFVVDELQRNAAASQGPLISLLQQRNAKFEPFWITNSVLVEADDETRKMIAGLPEVESIEPDEPIALNEPQNPVSNSAEPDVYSSGLTVEWNVNRTRAPEVWDNYHAEGAGIVIGIIDTGYSFHPAINQRYRGYRGVNTYDHNYNWYDPIAGDLAQCVKTPCDDNGHGTHVTGTAVGRDGDHVYGVAPEAQFISCRALKNGFGTTADIIKCYQWFLEPRDLNFSNPDTSLRPQIVSQSLGGSPSTAVAQSNTAMIAAGILSVAAAGNNGGCKTVSYPGGYPDVLAVGALGYESNTIAYFSSGGPSLYASAIKPDVMAGGASVTSAWLSNGYKTISGTSMATPAVSGVAALVMSAVPHYFDHPGDLISLLQATANRDVAGDTRNSNCGLGYPNNLTGWGEIDAYQAVHGGLLANPLK